MGYWTTLNLVDLGFTKSARKAVFGGKKQVSMFEMTKLVSKHVK
ncbi:MAG: hypothetical protein NTV93_07680 [Verrucomicrobia bacterium]|nr:hypothetical protein [Verrucomicrobiota bacterium]